MTPTIGWIITGWTIGPNGKLISTGYAPGYEGITNEKNKTNMTKVFRLNDCDWWMAESLEAAKADYTKETGLTEEDEPFDDPHELDEETMDTLIFVDDGIKRTFREELARRIAIGDTLGMFATTE